MDNFIEIDKLFVEVQIMGQPKEYNKDRLESKTPQNLSESHYFTHYRRFHHLTQGMPGKNASA